MIQNVEQYAKEEKWELAYRNAHSAILAADEVSKARARALMEEHPEILAAGVETFSIERLRSSVRAYTNVHVALERERERLSQFQFVGSQEMYITARTNLKIVEQEVRDGILVSSAETFESLNEQEMMRKESLERKKQQERLALMREDASAEAAAIFTCVTTRVCEKAFVHAQLFLNDVADMKIQVSTNAIVETYTPTDGYQIGGRVTKAPGQGESETIRLSLFCKPYLGEISTFCLNKRIRVYLNFPRYLEIAVTN